MDKLKTQSIDNKLNPNIKTDIDIITDKINEIIDKIAIVRCKDCKYSFERKEGELTFQICKSRGMVFKEGFCHMWEVREDGE